MKKKEIVNKIEIISHSTPKWDLLVYISIILSIVSLFILYEFEQKIFGLIVLIIGIIGLFVAKFYKGIIRLGYISFYKETIDINKNSEKYQNILIFEINQLIFQYSATGEAVGPFLDTYGTVNYIRIVCGNGQEELYLRLFIKTDRQLKFILRMLDYYKAQGVNVRIGNASKKLVE